MFRYLLYNNKLKSTCIVTVKSFIFVGLKFCGFEFKNELVDKAYKMDIYHCVTVHCSFYRYSDVIVFSLKYVQCIVAEYV